MRIAAISDIHSNHSALEAAADELNKYKPDLVAFLGDYVSDCPYPQKTLKLLREITDFYPSKVIKGNREQYFIDYRKSPNGWKFGTRSGSLLYTYENLTDEDIDYFASLPFSTDIDSEYGKIILCHGSPDDCRLVIKPESEELDRTMKNADCKMILCGHSHTSFVDERYGKIMVNSGSMGVPVSTTETEFAIIDIEKQSAKAEIVRVPYNVKEIISEFVPSGLFDKAATCGKTTMANIITGDKYNQRCVHRVIQLANERKSYFDDEKLWEQAARELGIDYIIREALAHV